MHHRRVDHRRALCYPLQGVDKIGDIGDPALVHHHHIGLGFAHQREQVDSVADLADDGEPGTVLNGCPVAGEVEGDVDEHVFLSADQTASSGFFEERARVDIEAVGDRLGVAQEA